MVVPITESWDLKDRHLHPRGQRVSVDPNRFLRILMPANIADTALMSRRFISILNSERVLLTGVDSSAVGCHINIARWRYVLDRQRRIEVDQGEWKTTVIRNNSRVATYLSNFAWIFLRTERGNLVTRHSVTQLSLSLLLFRNPVLALKRIYHNERDRTQKTHCSSVETYV